MLLRHSLAYLPGAAGPPIFAFLTLIVFSRLLTPEQYGRFALVIATVELFKGGFFLWVKISLLRFFPAAENKQQLADLLRSGSVAFWLSAAIAAPVFLVLTYSGFFDSQLQYAMLLGLPLLVAKAGAEQTMEQWRADLRPGVFSLMQAGQAAIGFAVALSLTVFVLPTEQSLLLGTLIGLVVVWLPAVSKWSSRAKRGVIRRDIVRSFIGYGLPMSLTALLTFVVASSDRYMLEYLMDTASVGLYSVSYSLAERALIAIIALTSLAGLPLALKALENDGENAARAQMRSNFTLVVALGCPATVGLIILAEPIANTFLGSDYRDAASQILPLIAFAAFMAGFKIFYLDHAFHLGKRTGLLVLSFVPPALINILANAILIPIYGLLGAVYATVLAYTVAVGCSLFLGRRAFPLPLPVVPVLKTLAASFGMALTLILFSFPDGALGLILSIGTGLAVFAALAFVLDIGGLRQKLVHRVT